MKKYIMSFLAVVFAIALSSFSMQRPKPATTVDDPILYWFDGSTYSGFHQEVSLEKSRTGCTGNGTDCEQGYDGNQFNTPNNPSSGLKSGAASTVDIKHV
jgi:hypothetical protein